MLLSPEESDLFFKLHRSLMFYVNQRLQILPGISSPEEFSSLPSEQRVEVRDAFTDELDLLESFADENPADLSEEELEIVLSWHNLVVGRFFIFRQLKKYMVFLPADDPPVAYGVLALTEPFEEMIGPYLPVMTETVLLPLKDKIVYDGLLRSFNISFGGGVKQSLNDEYREAKQRLGIVTSLPIENVPEPKKDKTEKKTKKRAKNPFQGCWRITWMDQWDQDFVDEEVEGYFKFDRQGRGAFQFGYVRGQIDHRPSTRDGQPSIEFTWEGNDEMDSAMGRGWAVVDDEELNGMIYFHMGDESTFKAKRKG